MRWVKTGASPPNTSLGDVTELVWGAWVRRPRWGQNPGCRMGAGAKTKRKWPKRVVDFYCRRARLRRTPQVPMAAKFLPVTPLRALVSRPWDRVAASPSPSPSHAGGADAGEKPSGGLVPPTPLKKKRYQKYIEPLKYIKTLKYGVGRGFSVVTERNGWLVNVFQ